LGHRIPIHTERLGLRKLGENFQLVVQTGSQFPRFPIHSHKDWASTNKTDNTRISAILNGALASRADNNDTINLAVLGGLKDKEALKAFEVVHFMLFDPAHKRTEATVKDKDGKTFKATKGAPQVMLALSTNAV